MTDFYSQNRCVCSTRSHGPLLCAFCLSFHFNGFSLKFVCTMGMGPRTNLYRIGGDPLTQLNLFNYIFLNFVFLHKKR